MNIKQLLVATRKNNYHPYLVRPIGMVLFIIAILTVNITYNLIVGRNFQVLGYATDISVDEVIRQTNNQRQANGLLPLSVNTNLALGANNKAQDMLKNDYWSHVSPSGVQPWYFFTSSGYMYSTAGENLARNFDSTSNVMNGWMSSPEHRNNILNNSYNDIGVAVVNGVMGGNETTLIVALYGSLATAPSLLPVAQEKESLPSTPLVPPEHSEPPTIVSSPEPPASTASDTSISSQPKSSGKKLNHSGAPSTTKKSEINASKDVRFQYKNSLNWAQKVTLIMLSILFLVNVIKHTIVWRTQKRGWRHIWLRSHPAAQYVLIMVAILATATSGIGLII